MAFYKLFSTIFVVYIWVEQNLVKKTELYFKFVGPPASAGGVL